MLDIEKIYKKYNIPIGGVLHVGANDGGEVKTYQQMGFPIVWYFEANPKVYSRLLENIKGMNNIVASCLAVSDKTGTVKLHVTSNDQSSSILPLKHHKIVYPDIVEMDCIEVVSYTLDALCEKYDYSQPDFNFINIDIQGAELLAFKGATNLLKNHIKAINTEVNYEEMYEGCALKKDVDEYLGQFGFKCKETITPHPSWGDAFYIKG